LEPLTKLLLELVIFSRGSYDGKRCLHEWHDIITIRFEFEHFLLHVSIWYRIRDSVTPASEMDYRWSRNRFRSTHDSYRRSRDGIQSTHESQLKDANFTKKVTSRTCDRETTSYLITMSSNMVMKASCDLRVV
jgi:hypothetical protein